MSNYPRLTLTSHTQTYTFNSNHSEVKIGRSLKCDFNIPREDLSREHCLFETINDEFYITDLGSKNGVWVDRIRLIPFRKTKVTYDSKIILANIYELRINAYEIKTKSDIVYKIPKADLQTVTFDFDPEEHKTPEVPVEEEKLPPPELIEEYPSPKRETIKMVVGFVAIFCGVVLVSWYL